LAVFTFTTVGSRSALRDAIDPLDPIDLIDPLDPHHLSAVTAARLTRSPRDLHRISTAPIYGAVCRA
jgi:hypothetical protein